MQAFKQASNDRATKAVAQSEPSSKVPLQTEKEKWLWNLEAAFSSYANGKWDPVKGGWEKGISCQQKCPSILEQECYLACKSISACAAFI